MDDVTIYKVKFNRKLAPLKAMLVNKKSRMNVNAWRSLILKTEERIILNPVEYLGEELPSSETTSLILKIIFSEFVARELRYYQQASAKTEM